MNFNICGCRIKIDFWFILVLSIAALLSADGLLYILLFSILHELGHLIALVIAGGKADELRFSYYGIALKYSSSLSRFRELAVIIAGPLVNLLLYIIFKDNYNLILFAINILPVYPLDGGRALDLFFIRLSRKLSYVILALMYALSLYLLVKYKSFSMLMIAIYLTLYSINY